MRMSELQSKDIIDLSDGKKIGRIIDAVIDDLGHIQLLIILKSKMFNVLPLNNEIEVKWEQIKTIGINLILINMK